MNKDMKAGEVREWNGKSYKAELSYSCQECALFNMSDCRDSVSKLGNCGKSEREYERDEIIFREVK